LDAKFGYFGVSQDMVIFSCLVGCKTVKFGSAGYREAESVKKKKKKEAKTVAFPSLG
jgi:hypothetical protein